MYWAARGCEAYEQIYGEPLAPIIQALNLPAARYGEIFRRLIRASFAPHFDSGGRMSSASRAQMWRRALQELGGLPVDALQ